VLFFIDSVTQAQLLLRDLKIAQCKILTMPFFFFSFFFFFLDMKLPPRAAFTAQIIGTLIGSSLNFGPWFASFLICDLVETIFFFFFFFEICRCSTVLMTSIIDNHREILLSVQGTNIWSGQQPQQYNSQAIAWGGLR